MTRTDAPTTPTTRRLPTGFRVRIRPEVERHDADRLLVGGSPLRALRLSSAAQELIRDGVVEVASPAGHALAVRLLDSNVADPVLDHEPVHAAQLTVVIPVRDRPRQLDRALAALAPLRCVVVDDASLDAAAIEAVTDRHETRLVRLPVNAGPGAARNAGLREVDTCYVAFVDSDVEVGAQVLLDLTRHFADTAVGMVAPLVRSRSRSARPRWFERHDERSSSLALGERACQVAPGAHVGWLPSACLVARRAVLGDGFDPELRAGEDVDLVWRLVRAGTVVRYDPSGTAWHDARPSVREWLGRKFVYGTGGAVLAQRHGAATAVAALSPAMALAGMALMQRRRWSAVVAAACLLHAGRVLRRNLPDAQGRDRIAIRLACRGVGWSLRQQAALLLRHWAPAALLAGLWSRPVRRALVSALLIDTAVNLPRTRQLPFREQVSDAAARRLDDLAYGTGLWAGAVRARRCRAWHCLGIRVTGRARGRSVPRALLRA